MKIIPVEILTEQKRDECLEEGCNPPVDSESFSRLDFVDEWHGAFSSTKAILTKQWTSGVGEGIDFFMDSDIPNDRIIFVEIVSLRMISRQFIIRLIEAIHAIEADYVIAACNDFVFLRTESGDAYPDFNLFVTKRSIRVYAESEVTLKSFGLCESLFKE